MTESSEGSSAPLTTATAMRILCLGGSWAFVSPDDVELSMTTTSTGSAMAALVCGQRRR
jgi:hypothetical protein